MSRSLHIHVDIKLMLTTCLVCLCSVLAISQVDDQINTYTRTIRADINLIGETLLNKTIDSVVSPGFISSVSLELIHGELHLNYELHDQSSEEQRNEMFHVHASVLIDGKELRIRPDKFLGDYGQNLTTTNGHSKEFIITDLVDDFLMLEGELIILLTIVHEFEVVLDFEFNCNVEPQFTFGQRVPYLIGAATGVGAIVWGAVIEAEAQDKYDEYKMKLDSDDALYDEANREHKSAQALMISGGIVVAVDAALYFIRANKYKKRRTIFDKYCVDGGVVEFRPKLDFPNIASPSGSVGLAINYTF